jgi:branched-chain amino acid transport system substrate-binding protein
LNQMKHKPRFLATLLGVALLAGTAFGANNTVKVGIFAQGSIGKWERQGYTLAIEKLREEGIQLEPIYLGCPGNVNWVMKKVEALDGKGVVALIGGSNSKCTSYLAGVAQRHKIPLISPFSPMELLSRFGFDYVFRLNAPIRWYIDSLLEYAAKSKDKPQTVAFVWEDTPFGRRFTVFAEDKAKALGLKVVASEKIDFADKGKKAAEKVAESKADILMLVGNQEDGLRVLGFLKKENYSPKVLLGAGAGFSMPSFVKAQGGLAEGLVTVSQWYPSVGWPGVKDFVSQFKERYKREPNYLSAEAYAAIQVLGEALKTTKCAGKGCRAKLKNALIETKADTVFGPVRFEDFSGYTNQNRHPLLLLKIEKGKLKIVAPAELANN